MWFGWLVGVLYWEHCSKTFVHIVLITPMLISAVGLVLLTNKR